MQRIFERKRHIYLSGYFVISTLLIFSIYSYGWVKSWTKILVPTMTPFFADLRSIQGAVISSASGLNPQIKNPGDPWGRTMNYPSIWTHIGGVLNIQNPNNFLIFGLIIVFSFIACSFVLLSRYPSIWIFIGLLSNSTLLGIERGNIDLLIFVLITSSVIAPRFLQAPAFLLSVALKIYPIFALFSLRLSRKRFVVTTTSTLLILIFLIPQYKNILRGNTAETNQGFGLKTTLSVISKNFSSIIQYNFKLVYSLICIFLFVVMAATWLYRKKIRIDFQNGINNIERDSLFLAGGTIYVCIFAFTSNWDYRLIFLIMCIPKIATLENRYFRAIFQILIVLCMNGSYLVVMMPTPLAALITTIARLIVFVLLLALIRKVLYAKMNQIDYLNH